MTAVAVLPDGRVVTGGSYDGRVLVWDPAEPGAGPVELGRHERRGDGGGGAAGRAGGHRRRRRRAGAGVGPGGAGRRPGRARPPRRRGGGGGGAAGRAGGHRRRRRRRRVLVWDPAEPGAGPVELGRHEGGVAAVAVLPDGRVVTGGDSTTAGCWCGTRRSRAPARSSSAATSGGVTAVAVLPDGRVVTGGDDDRVRLWNVQSSSPGTLLACSAYALATSLSPSGARLFIGHAVGGISCWEVRPATQNTPGARQRAGNAMHQQT